MPGAGRHPVALSSPARTIQGIVCAAEVSDQAWGPRTALTTTPAEMAAALERVAGPAVTALIDWTPDAAIHNIVKTWPARIHAECARGLGLLPEVSCEEIIRAYVRENPYAIKHPIAGK